MRPIYRIFIFLLTIAIFSLTMGCSSDTKQYRIGVSQCSEDDWRRKMNDEINREVMFHEDAMVEIRSADDSSDKQIEDIRYFADNGFDIIIVSPNEASRLTPVINEIHRRGIPVIIFDRNIKNDEYTARIGADDKGLGRQAAHYALSILGRSPKALEIYGLPGSTPADDRHAGFSKEFEAAGGTLLASVPANWRKEDAIPVADSLLKAHPDANLIFAHNDRMAIGAAEVARRMGKKDLRIIGIDAAPTIGIKAVADSVIDATFLYPTEGHRLIRTALAILKGEPYNKEVILPVSSAVDLSNADILLRQNENLVEETDKMKILKNRIDDYWAQHSSQTFLFYACLAIIVLLFGVIFLVVKSFWQNRRHQTLLLEQNRMLEEERDKQKELNVRLEDERDKQKELNVRLKEATQSKLMFFTNVSHDLRTPLTLIAEPVAQLAEADNLTKQQQTLIRVADKNVRILRRLINQILDFRKYENDKLELTLTEIDLGRAIEEWMESFRSLAVKRNMKLSLRQPEISTDTTIAVDVEKIERVFFNLVSNAFKYTPDNGSIAVSYAVSADRFAISVADTGKGISDRDLGNIFDRFFQVDRVHPNGSGIGLSLCKAFVEMHGGTISVESTVDKGSIFSVSIPVRHIEGAEATVPENTITSEEVDAELAPMESTIVQDGAKPVMLVIDDNKDIQTLIRELMGNEYSILTASDGASGLKRAARHVPDIIVCDVMMPVMDGMECCRRLKEEVSTSHIPVLMLTACSMDEQRAQGFDSGADGYIAKPFSDKVLRAQCASLIANRRRIKELWKLPSAQPGAEDKKRRGALPTSEIDNDFYNRFLEVFTPQMGNPDLSVDSIAGQLGLERSQFYRKIKALTNYSPVELIRILRLRQGRTLLTSTEKSISEVAYDCGFSSPAYFTKCYKEAFGMTPSEARN